MREKTHGPWPNDVERREEQRVPGARTPWIKSLLASPDPDSRDHAGRAVGGVESDAARETRRDEPPWRRLAAAGQFGSARGGCRLARGDDNVESNGRGSDEKKTVRKLERQTRGLWLWMIWGTNDYFCSSACQPARHVYRGIGLFRVNSQLNNCSPSYLFLPRFEELSNTVATA